MTRTERFAIYALVAVALWLGNTNKRTVINLYDCQGNSMEQK